MAVEATYMNLLPSQLLTNREIVKPNQHHHQLNSDFVLNGQMDSLPLPTTATMAEPFLLFNYQSNFCDPNKADSGLTYHVPPFQRKRSRSAFSTEFTSLPPPQKNKLSSQSPLLTHDIFFQFQNQQSEIDRVVAHHAEKVRMELEEQKMRQSRVLMNAIQEAMAMKLKEKDEEIQRIGKLNWALQERVKSLCVENQIWRELAQTNETTANYLRTNLEQVLAHIGSSENCGVVHAVVDDVQSSCGNNHTTDNVDDTAASSLPPATTTSSGGGGARMCKNCGVRGSVVLLLPCRHLCLCTLCGSTVHNCPVCDSGMDASVHVNLS